MTGSIFTPDCNAVQLPREPTSRSGYPPIGAQSKVFQTSSRPVSYGIQERVAPPKVDCKGEASPLEAE
jgi:hypothetical protein